ncbi:helix-turn-helix domain-containing protein [Aminipila sp.]|uniref:helix-turn-helix domain-containing protein n=1 Tax=Aminipila sp. TaxID=2060095 RepID=UPI0028A12EA5|nr:helix-turn-helix transcriptional regulator [Aminipila sp.]
MEIGKQIKKYRAERELSQDKLAEKIFVSRQTISNWENDKNYPDLKSLVLLSSLFDVSLDTLIKGDLEEMKEKIKTEDIAGFKRDGTIFTVLLLSEILLLVPLAIIGGYVGLGIWVLIAVVTMYYAFRVEKQKKRFDIQTYKEILAFDNNKNLNQIEKSREYGKRPYQQLLLAIGTGLLTIVVAIIMFCIFS